MYLHGKTNFYYESIAKFLLEGCFKGSRRVILEVVNYTTTRTRRHKKLDCQSCPQCHTLNVYLRPGLTDSTVRQINGCVIGGYRQSWGIPRRGCAECRTYVLMLGMRHLERGFRQNVGMLHRGECRAT